jgi:hypothetical protein
VGSMAGLDAFEKRKTSCPCRDWNPGSPSPQSIVQSFQATVPRRIVENIEVLKSSKKKKTFAINLEISWNFLSSWQYCSNPVPKQVRLCFLVCIHFHTQGFHVIWKKHFKGSSMEESWENTRLVTILTTLLRCL